MPRVRASVPASSRELYDAFARHLAGLGREQFLALDGARRFCVRWPDPILWAAEPLERRLATEERMSGFLLFLIFYGHLRPGYDFLLRRKLPSILREARRGPMAADLAWFLRGAASLGFTERTGLATASQIVLRLIIQTARPLGALAAADLEDLLAALAAREEELGRPLEHYRKAVTTSHKVLFHMGIFELERPHASTAHRLDFSERMAAVPEALRPSFVRYLERLRATHQPGTIGPTASRLAHFGRHIASVDPAIASLATLDRCRHIETYLSAVATATSGRTGRPLSASERRARVLAISVFLNDITEWQWPEAPSRRLLYRGDIPKLPRPLPRYLPPDADRRLVEALRRSPNRLHADALLLLRSTGLRIGELLDLELDCVHEVPDQGAWLKVPLGKLDSERMVPLDEEAVATLDAIAARRSPIRPMRHPRSGRPAEFLLTHHGTRVSPKALRQELARAATEARAGHVTPHALRHTFATSLINAGCSLQSLMALLGHVSAEMSLRYGRLFDATVREEYERALAQARTSIGFAPRADRDLEAGVDWRSLPVIKTRLGTGYCLRSLPQGPCGYANICEFCVNFRPAQESSAALVAQRADAELLAQDALERCWDAEAERHRALAKRIDEHLGGIGQ